MNPTFRPLTVHEMFFDEPVKLNIPYSILPKDLPEIATSPGVTSAPFKLNAKQIPAPSFEAKTGNFLENYWLPVLLITGVCIYAAVMYRKHLEDEKKRKN